MRRKRYGLVLLVLLLCVTGIACKKKEDYVARTVQDVCSVYAYENALAYTIDEEGNLYCFDRYDTEDGSQSMLQLVKVDKDGNELFRRTTEQIKNSGLTAIAVKDKLLYYTGHEFDIEKKNYDIMTFSTPQDVAPFVYKLFKQKVPRRKVEKILKNSNYTFDTYALDMDLIIKKCLKCGATVEVLHDCTCDNCGIKCCGDVMKTFKENTEEASFEKHIPVLTIEGDKIVAFVPHVMDEDHYIEWIAYVDGKTVDKRFLKISRKILDRYRNI